MIARAKSLCVATLVAVLLWAQDGQAKQFQKTVSSSSDSAPIALDLTTLRCGVALLVAFSAGASLTVDVQVTGDDVGANVGNNYSVSSGYVSASGHWNAHDTLQGLTASANGNIVYPVTAVRLHPTSYSSGSATLSVIESDKCGTP